MPDLKPILLVEDDPKDVELTLLALDRSRLANAVLVVRDGAEALDFLTCTGSFANRAKGAPAVILMDLKLPKMSGLEALEKIKQREELRPIPVVMLTSSREEPDLTEAYRLGANAYVVKPVEFKEFLAAINDLGVFWGLLNEPPPGSAKLRSPGIGGLSPRKDGTP